MKKGIHPNYRPVVFQDAAANFSFLTSSCVETDETDQVDRREGIPAVQAGNLQRQPPVLHRQDEVRGHHRPRPEVPGQVQENQYGEERRQGRREEVSLVFAFGVSP